MSDITIHIHWHTVWLILGGLGLFLIGIAVGIGVVLKMFQDGIGSAFGWK